MKRENKKFVIQQHSKGPDIHWDFMLEFGNVLLTYRLDRPPQQLVQTTAAAVKIFDHPMRFLTYEGPLNKGQGRVRIADSGTFKIINHAQDRIKLDLNGKILKGGFTLLHIEGDNWQFGKSNV